MNTTLLQTEWESCLLEPGQDREVEALARRAYGTLPPHLPFLLHCPWVARASMRLNTDQGMLVALDFELADLVTMVVSQENSCRYCFAVSHLLLRLKGMSEARIAELQARLAAGTGDARTTAAVTFARRMSRAQPLAGPEERRRLAQAGFAPEEIREIAYVVAYLSWVNRVSTILAVSPHGLERLPDRWLFRLLRPLLARVVARRRSRGVPAATPAAAAGPYADVVGAYAGSPMGAALAAVLEEQWASPVLTRRCKALLYAVVATGLDCRFSLDQAQALLRAEGLDAGVAERAVRHLQAPELEPVENLLLPFARDTIWYQPAPMQRRAREVRDRLTPAQFVEAVGVVSLANALCRLTPVVVAVEQP